MFGDIVDSSMHLAAKFGANLPINLGSLRNCFYLLSTMGA